MPQTSFLLVEIHNVTDLAGKPHLLLYFSTVPQRNNYTQGKKSWITVLQTRATARIKSTSRCDYVLLNWLRRCLQVENLPPPATCAILVWKLGLKDALVYDSCIAKLTQIPLMQDGFVVHYSLHHQMTVSKLIQSHGPDDSGTVFSIAQRPKAINNEAFSKEIFKRSAFQGYTTHFVSQIFTSTTPSTERE